MGRGRKKKPDAVKAVTARSPLDRRRAIERMEQAAAAPPAPPPEPPPEVVPPPSYLSGSRELEIFAGLFADPMMRRLSRSGSVIGNAARLSFYQAEWERALALVDCANLGQRRRNPAFANVLLLERAIRGLEERLGLTPSSREKLIRNLAAMPPPPTAREEADEQADAPAGDGGPLGYLRKH